MLVAEGVVAVINPFQLYVAALLLYSYKNMRFAAATVFSTINNQSIVELKVIACGYIMATPVDSSIGLATATGRGPTKFSSGSTPLFCIIKVPKLVLVESYEAIGVVAPVNMCSTARNDIVSKV